MTVFENKSDSEMSMISYKFSELIEEVVEYNSDLTYGLDDIVGVTMDKKIIPTVANLTKTDLSEFYLVKPDTFIYNPRTHGVKLGMGYNQTDSTFITSWNNIAFRVKESALGILNPDYLWLYFNRSEWDRESNFMAWGSSTIVFSWNIFSDMTINLPPKSYQDKVVRQYTVIEDRINLKKRINENLTEQIVLLYKQRFPLSENPSLNATISDYCDKIYSGGTPLTTEETFWGGKYNWLSSGETSQDYIISTEKTITDDGINNSTTKLAEKGTVVIASAGQGITRGQTSLLFIDTYINQSLIALKPKKNLLGILYSNLKGRYNEMRNLSDLDSIRGSLTTKSISSLPIYLPDMEMAYKFNTQCIVLFKKIHANVHEIKKLNELSKIICASISI